MALDPLGVGDENLPNEEAGNLTEGPPPMDFGESPSTGEPAPLPGEQPPPPPSPWLHPFTPNPDTQPGGQDYSAPREPFKPPVTDLSQQLLNDDQLNVMAGHPGLLHTLGEQFATKAGLTELVPFYRQLPPAVQLATTFAAFQRLKASKYTNPQDEEKDLHTVTGWFNATRLNQKMDENRSFMGEATKTLLTMLPLGAEIGLTQVIGKRLGLPATVTEAAEGATIGRTAEMTAFRVGAIKTMNKFIGEGGEQLLAKRLAEYSAEKGLDVALAEWNAGSKELQAAAIQEARQSLARNILFRTATELSPLAKIAAAIPHAEVDVAQQMIDSNVGIRWLSRMAETAFHLPLMAAGSLIGAGPERQLTRGIQMGPDGNLKFVDTGETMPESVLKGAASTYVDYLSMHFGGEIQGVLKTAVVKPFAALKLADLASQLPGGAKMTDKLGIVMQSPTIQRGMTVAARFMNQAALKGAVYDPVSQVIGQNILGGVAKSVLNLDDDGVTPWSTRVVQSLSSPILHPEHTLAALVGFAMLPAGAFAVGVTLHGSLTDAEMKANREAIHRLQSRAPEGAVFEDSTSLNAAVDATYALMKTEHEKGLDSSWLGGFLDRAFGLQTFAIRPGSMLDLVRRSPLGGWDKDVSALRDRLLKGSPEESKDFMRRVLTLTSDHLVQDGVTQGNTSEMQESYSFINNVMPQMANLFKDIKALAPDIAERIGVPGKQDSVIDFTQQRATLEEQVGQKTPFAVKAIVGNLSVPRLKASIERAEKMLRDPNMSEENRVKLQPKVDNLKLTLARILQPDTNLVRVLGTNMRIFHKDLTAEEAAGTGAFKGAQQVTSDALAHPEKNPFVQSWQRTGYLDRLRKVLDVAIKDPDVDYYWVSGFGMEGLAKEFAAQGYDAYHTGRKASYGLFVPAKEGRKARVYLTNDTRPFDVIHEIGHSREVPLAQFVAKALLKVRREEQVLSGTAGWSTATFDYLRKHVPEGVDLPLYLDRIARGTQVAIPPKFIEDAVNLLAFHMGYGRELPRGELAGARQLYGELATRTPQGVWEENKWFAHGMESVLREHPVLSASDLHASPFSAERWADLQKSVGDVPKAPAPVQAAPELQVSPAPSVLEKPSPAPGPLEKGFKPEIKAQMDRDSFGTAPRSSLGELEPEVPLTPTDKDKRLAILHMARILSIHNFRAAPEDTLLKLDAEGKVDMDHLGATLKAMRLDVNVMTPELRDAYYTLLNSHADLLADILTKPAGGADGWLAKLSAQFGRKSTTLPEGAIPIEKATKTESDPSSLVTEEMEERNEAHMDSEEMPMSVLLDDSRMLRMTMARTEVRNFFKLLDQTAGIDRVSYRSGETHFPIYMNREIGGRPLVRELFETAMRSRKDFEDATTKSDEFMTRVLGKAKPPADITDFWMKRLAPVLRMHAYEDFNNPKQLVSMGRALAGIDLQPVWGVSVSDKGGFKFTILNLNRRIRTEATLAVMQRAEKLRDNIQKGKQPESVAWDNIAKDLMNTKGLSPALKGAFWSRFRTAMTTPTPRRADLVDGLRIASRLLPMDALGLKFEDLTALLTSHSTADGVHMALRNLANHIGKNTTYADLLMALHGGRGEWGLIPDIVVPALARNLSNLDTSAHVWGRRPSEARTGIGLRRTLGGENLKALNDMGLHTGDQMELHNLSWARRTTTDERGNSRTDVVEHKNWTADDREAMLDQWLLAANNSQDPNPKVMIPIVPRGKKTVMPFAEMNFIKDPKQLSAAYQKLYAWRQLHGGILHLRTPDQFNADVLKAKTPMAIGNLNLVLHHTALAIMTHGSYESYDKSAKDIQGFLNFDKRGEQVGDGTPLYPTEDGVKGDIGVLRIAKLHLVSTEDGVAPVTGATDLSKAKDFPLMDGQIIVTRRGARDFHVGDKASLKGLLSWVSKTTWGRGLLKGNSVLLDGDTMAELHPAIGKLLDRLDKEDLAHPDKPIHFISVDDNFKTFPEEGKPPVAALTWGDNNELAYNKEALENLDVDQLPLEAFTTVSNLEAGTKPEPVTTSNQMLAATPIRDIGKVKQILFDLSRYWQDKMPNMWGSLKEIEAALNKYLDVEEDPNLRRKIQEGLPVHLLSTYANRLLTVVFARLKRDRMGDLNGLRTQNIDNTLGGKTTLRPPQYIHDNGTVLTGPAVKDAYAKDPNSVFLFPADYQINVEGGRYDRRMPFVSDEKDPKKAAVEFLWANKDYIPDIFRSTMATVDGKNYLQLEKKLLPDIEHDLDLKPVTYKGQAGYALTLRGQLGISTRIPGPSAEAVTLYRLSKPLGDNQKPNWSASNSKVRFNANADFDGDADFNYLASKDKDGRPIGLTDKMIDANDRIALDPEANKDRSPAAAMTLAHMLMARGMLYLGESPDYFNPAIGLDPVNRELAADHYEAIAKPKLDRLLEHVNREGWNSAAAIRFLLRVPGEAAPTLGVAVRNHAVTQFLFEEKQTPDRSLRAEIPGIAAPFVTGPGDHPRPERRKAILDGSAEIVGLVADNLKNFYALSLNLKQDYIGLVYAALMMNPHLERVEMLKTDVAEADKLKSFVGTLGLLQSTLFSDDMIKRLEVSGYKGNRVLEGSRGLGNLKDPRNLWLDPKFRDLLRMTHSLRWVERQFDAYRNMDAKRAEGFGEPGILDSKGLSRMGIPPLLIYRPESMWQTPGIKRSLQVIVRARDILPTIPESIRDMDTDPVKAKDMFDDVFGNQPKEFQDKYAGLVSHGLEDPANQTAWTQELLSPRLKSDVTRGQPITEDLQPSDALTAAKPEKTTTVPALSYSAFGREDAGDLDTEFEKLPIDFQKALALNALEHWGLSGMQNRGSYASLLPSSIMKWLIGEMAKVDPEIQTALGERGAAAPARAEVATSPRTEKTSGAASPINIWYGSGENAILSNLSPRRLVYDGRTYRSVEQAYQSLKSGKFDEATWKKYQDLKDVAGVKIVGGMGTKTTEQWNLKLMESLLRESFHQDFDAAKALKETRSAPLTHIQDKGVWAKELPRILMDIRKDLQNTTFEGEAASTPATKAPVAPNIATRTDFQSAAENHEIPMSPKDFPPDDDAPRLGSSMSEHALLYRAGERFDPNTALHQEMRKRFAFTDRMNGLAHLAITRLYANTGYGKPNVPEILKALSFYFDSPGDDAQKRKAPIRLAGNSEAHFFYGRDPDTDEVRLRKRFVSTGDTVGSVMDAYEAYRKAHPDEKLMPLDKLIAEAPGTFKHARDELNQHAQEFVDSPELFADITRRFPDREYVPHVTMSPFESARELGEQVREALNRWYGAKHKPGESFYLVIKPQGVAELVEGGKLPASQAAINAHAFEALDKMTPQEREASINLIVKDAKEQWTEMQRPPKSILQETTGAAQYREKELDEEFEKYGRVLRNPNYAAAFEEYVAKNSDFAASKRYMSYMANLTDYFGTPAAFFMGAKKVEAKEQEQLDKSPLLSPTVLRTQFENWYNRLKLDGYKADPYDMTKSIWENLGRLHQTAETEGWFKDNGYSRVELTNTKGFSHAWVLDGAPRRLLEHVTSRGVEDLKPGVVKWGLQRLIWFGQLTKQLTLGFSLFHAAALMEAHVSSYGITHQNPLLNPIKFLQNISDILNISKEAIANPEARETLSGWMTDGLTFKFNDPNLLNIAKQGEGGPVDTFLAKAPDWLASNALTKWMAPGARVARDFKRWGDHMLWEVLQPASKLMLAQRAWSEILANPAYDKFTTTAEGRTQVRREIAQKTNQIFGGIDWHEMIWATPMMRDILRATFFASDWTFSNLQAAMVPDLLQRLSGTRMPFGPTGVTDIRSKFLLEKYWPTYIYITLMAVPAAWQGLIYAAFGKPDEGDQPWMWMNEEDKKFAVDLSPLFRAMDTKFGITEHRRSYLQWGKSGYEIGAWFKNPWQAFLNKTSMGVKVFWENMTGRNTAGWDMPWAQENASMPFGSLFAVNGSLAKGRLAYIAQKFVPMTLMNLISKDRAPSFFAPTSLGKNQMAAERQMADVFQAYGDDTVWSQIIGRPEKVRRLETLVNATLEAAWLNGYNPKELLTNAKRLVHARQANEFFTELERHPTNPNLAKLEKIARAAQRTDTMQSNFMKAVETRYGKRQRDWTPRQRQAFFDAWQNAQENQGEQP